MIPPLALDVQPGHLVLDMCAAPGSKTTQMLEKMNNDGVVIGNDVEWKRANTLAHRSKRCCSASAMITNFDANFFPWLSLPTFYGFDRILCDVPCSADGTIRKNPRIWDTWSLQDGMAMHSRQLRILLHGMSLLKVDGLLVYSTCSLNPLENEAVVSAALER